MGQSKRDLALLATRTALRIRQQAGCNLQTAICVYDLCERLGVSVRFSDIPSMEGIYLPDAHPRPAIVVSSLRPAGRQSMTCGHEMGHHAFGHGEQFDELIEDRSDQRKNASEEFLADLFSAVLHMPKLAVAHAFSKRALDPATCTPEAVFAIAGSFSVGYGTLITHMARTLKIISATRESELVRHQPKDLRASLFGRACPTNLYVADHHWTDRAIDVQADDIILLPAGAEAEGACITVLEQSTSRTVVKAVTPGIGRVFQNAISWAAFVRVTRRDYVGRSAFRFEPEVDDVE